MRLPTVFRHPLILAVALVARGGDIKTKRPMHMCRGMAHAADAHEHAHTNRMAVPCACMQAFALCTSLTDVDVHALECVSAWCACICVGADVCAQVCAGACVWVCVCAYVCVRILDTHVLYLNEGGAAAVRGSSTRNDGSNVERNMPYDNGNCA